LHKIMLFVPLGAILAATWSTADKRRVGMVALLLTFMIASAVEVGQFYLPSHTASVTDVLVEMAGTLLGCGLGVRLRAALAQASLPDWRTHGIHG
jgi:VanZ family protein